MYSYNMIIILKYVWGLIPGRVTSFIDFHSSYDSFLYFQRMNWQSIVVVISNIQWISVALENSVEGVSCPDNINSVYCLWSGNETPSTEFSNATKVHCNN